tara:strand:+ start:721 stop:927 length:207 start_codon:yes stop_codon:yes gene_type:complete
MVEHTVQLETGVSMAALWMLTEKNSIWFHAAARYIVWPERFYVVCVENELFYCAFARFAASGQNEPVC